MQTDNTIRVLLLANEFHSAQIMWAKAIGGAGFDIVKLSSRDAFLREMREGGPDIVVVESDAIDGLTMEDVLEAAADASPEVSVIVLGADDEDGRDAIRFLDQGAADYVSVSTLQRLPAVLRRLRREREVVLRQHELEAEIRQVHGALLENQKLMAIGRLAASIAHEINNPLESITNLLYLLRTDRELSPKSMNYVGLAEREMERVAQISKQTLNFYRETRTPVKVRPSELIEEVLVLYARKIEERRMEIVRQYKTDASLFVFPGEIRQVLSNLVTNAIEASPVGGKLTLRIRRARKWSDEGITGIRIVVADNGCGIAAETRYNLGQLFYTTKGQRGTGLGLWVSRAIIRRYGGEIQLYSSTREGRRGTVFSIFMPTNLRSLPVAIDTGPIGNGGGGRRGGTQSVPGLGKVFGGARWNGTESAQTREVKRKRVPLVAS